MTKISVRRRNRQSAKLQPKKTTSEIRIQMICLLNKELSPVNDDIVMSPAAKIGKMAKNKI